MILNEYKWVLAPVVALVFSIFCYALPQNIKVSQHIYYYNGYIEELALETHRVKWSIIPEKNVCTTVSEQLLPAYSYDAIVPDHSIRLGACLFRKGHIYLNFIQDDPPPASRVNFTEESGVHILQMVKMALRLNHHYIRQISININSAPWDG